MNIMAAISEIGILETLRVVSQNPKCMENIALYIPPVKHEFVEARIRFLADVIRGTGKSHLFIMSPETALLEQLAQSGWGGTAIIGLPHDLEEESRERIYANIPSGVDVEFVGEGAYPPAFRPDNGLIACAGIVPFGHRQYVTPSNCRMASLYKVFQGSRMLLSCFPQGVRIPEIGWTYTETDFFTQIIEEV